MCLASRTIAVCMSGRATRAAKSKRIQWDAQTPAKTPAGSSESPAVSSAAYGVSALCSFKDAAPKIFC
eukprot:15340554-Heterocapsa_arctica.AAC.1